MSHIKIRNSICRKLNEAIFSSVKDVLNIIVIR